MAKLLDMKMTHQGEYLSQYELTYELSDGSTKKYEMTSRRGSKHSNGPLTIENLGKNVVAVVLVVFDKCHTKMLLNKEYRMGINDWIYGNVAGLIDKGEDPIEAATRELKEETGLDLISVRHMLPPSHTVAGMSDELIITMVCEASGEIRPSDSAAEEIEAVWLDMKQARELLFNDKVNIAGRAQAFIYGWVMP